jgi:membrane-anchored glycerophosphoryl diester phosphodiesterase (GDPDase)
MVSTVVGAVVFEITTTLLIGLLIVAVSRSVLGTRMTIGEIWQHAKPQLWRLLVVTFVVGIMVGVVAVLWIAGMIWSAITQNFALLGVIALVGGLGTLVWTGWMTVRTLLATPALMLERLHMVESVRRSFRLTKGSFWRLLGIYLLASILVGVVAQIVGVPISILASILLVTTNGDPAVLAITSALTSVIAALITTPFSAAVVALLYIDTRMRREGLDVQLVRSVQEQAA